MSQGTQTSIVHSFSQADFDSFARLSGAGVPMHWDPGFSAGTRLGRPVAHGQLLCSVLRGLIDRVVPGGRLKEQTVAFPAPTFADESMRFIVTVKRRSQGKTEASFDFELEVMRIEDGVLTCHGHGRVVV